MLTALLGCATTALGQIPQAAFSFQSKLALTNAAFAVEVAGNLAYVADSSPRLNVIDVSNPAAPKIVGGIATGATVRDIFVAGNLAYVAASTAGLQIFDISNPAQPTLVKTLDTPSEAFAIEVANNIAYLANGTSGLHLIDVTDPANPVQVGRYDSPGTARDVALRGNFAYLADLDPGIQVIDVSNPAAPIRRFTYNTPDWAVGIQIVGDIAYVADDTAGLVVLDVQNPVPVRLGGVDTTGLLSSIHVEDNHAYVSGSSAGVVVIDITDPKSPAPVGTYVPGGASTQIQVVDGRVYVANGFAGLEIFDARFGLTQSLVVENPRGTVLAVGAPYPLQFAANSGLPLNIQIEGPVRVADGVLTATNLGRISIVIEQPGNAQYLPMRLERQFNVPGLIARQLGTFVGAGSMEDIQVVGHTAWIANGWNGLLAVNMGNPSAPSIQGRLPTTGVANAVSVVDQTAFLAAGSQGLVIVDTSNPTNLIQRASVATRGNSQDVHVVDGIAYVAEETGGLSIISVTNPAAPIRLNAQNIGTNVQTVHVTGGRAYLAQGFLGFSILDVSNPSLPVHLGGFPSSTVRDLEVIGHLAYVASSSGGLVIYDVANPTQIRRLGQVAGNGNATRVKIVGSLAYVADTVLGVHVIDVTNPEQPKSLGSFMNGDGASAAEVVGNRVYALTWAGRCFAFDVRLGSPQELGWQLPSSLTIGAQELPLLTPTTAGLQPRFSVVKGPARILNGTLVFTGVGRIVLRAEQEGDESFLPFSTEFTFQAELPDLNVTNVGGEVVVSWPAGITNVILQGTAALNPGTAWSTATLPRSEASGEVQVRPGDSPLQFFRLQGFTGEAEPLQLTGWNRDVVLENSPTRRASAVDNFGGAWFEAGLQGYLDGLPTNRTVVSQINDAVSFELQPYTGSNVLALTIARRTNSLELTQPKALSRLHVLAHSAGGGGNGQLRIHYADGTVSAIFPFFAPDWWDGSPSTPTRRPAVDGLGRSSTAGTFTYEWVGPGFSLHQTDIDLSTGPNVGKVITRLEFVRHPSAEVTCIFAVSGVPMPPAP